VKLSDVDIQLYAAQKPLPPATTSLAEAMLVCHCNVIAEKELEDIILAFLRDDPWQLLVPTKVYRELGKRGRCCGCFPNVVDIIARVTEEYHLNQAGNSADPTDVKSKLAEWRRQQRGGGRERRSTSHRAA
jgi:hypothetical protein